ncbi:uncharacterized protein [Parasteatoda tepidariorum]|uniref:uncharacterized protein n=1 Tax=Parasteatoda tepidariorum TaxID=114398 RepID=UPI0039BD30BB
MFEHGYQYEKRKSFFKVPGLFKSKKSRENKSQTEIFREWINKKKFRISKKKFKKFLQIDIDENKFPESEEIFGKDKNSVWINEKQYSFTGESIAEPEDSLDNVYDKDEYLKYIVWVEEEYERILALFKQKDHTTDNISYTDRPKNDSEEMESSVNIGNKNSFRIPFDDFDDELK